MATKRKAAKTKRPASRGRTAVARRPAKGAPRLRVKADGRTGRQSTGGVPRTGKTARSVRTPRARQGVQPPVVAPVPAEAQLICASRRISPVQPPVVAPVPAEKAEQATLGTEPARAAQQTTEERVGVVTHYYTRLGVAIVRLESGTLRLGDTVHVRGHTSDFRQTVTSLQIEHRPVEEVRAGQEFGMRVVEHAREHDVVYRVTGA